MVLRQTDMKRWNINKCSPYRAVHSAQGPVNSILCTGDILTGRTGASTEPVFVNVSGDQESIPRIRFRQPALLKNAEAESYATLAWSK